MSKRILVNYFTEDMFKQNTRKLIYSKVFNSNINDIREIEKMFQEMMDTDQK